MQYRPQQVDYVLVDVHEVVRGLKQVADALSRAMVPAPAREDRFFWRAVFLLSISTGTFVLGLLGLVRQVSGRTDIINPELVFLFCLLPAGIAVFGFASVIIAALGRTSRTHLVLFEGVLIGGIGIYFAIFALVRDFNIEFDARPAAIHVLNGISAEHVIRKGRKGRTYHDYYLHATDWREKSLGQPIRLEIDSADYHRLKDATDAVISVKPGAIGFDWVEAIHPGDPWTEKEIDRERTP
jgi:hypothetical protein